VALGAAAGQRAGRLEGALAALLFALPLALFLPAREHAWLNYDDDVYITQNPELPRGITAPGVLWAFTTFQGANWFPLTWLSWMLDLELAGLDPAAFHRTSALLHAAAGALLFLALARLTASPWRSAFAAAVFAIHPLHVESVAWAAARKDPLSGLFFMLCLWIYAGQGPAGPSRRRLLAVFAGLALGLMAKPTLVTLPFVLLLLDHWPLGRTAGPRGPGRIAPAALRTLVREKLPLFGLAAAVGAVSALAQQSAGMVVGLERLPLAARIGNALVAWLAYLGKALWPAGLAVIYPHPGAALPAWKAAAAGLLLAALTAGALRRGRHPALAVGWLWYLATLLPVIGLVQVGSQAMADRYSYLPLVGLSLAAAFGLPGLLPARPAWRRGLAGVGLAALAALFAAAALQLRHWRDSEALFRHALAVTAENPIAHAHLAAALLEGGRPAEAIAHYRESIRLRPDSAPVANALAWLLATTPEAELKNPYLAVQLAERAVGLSGGRDPRILDTLAAAYADAGRQEEAAAAAERALALARERGDAALEAELRARWGR
jgi:tetratricopeptide (TPR) repeat protein